MSDSTIAPDFIGQLAGEGEADAERQHRLRMAGVDVISAMAAHALSAVDWLMLATSYLDLADERQMGMQGGTE